MTRWVHLGTTNFGRLLVSLGCDALQSIIGVFYHKYEALTDTEELGHRDQGSTVNLTASERST